jgi:hypothetical protein
MAIEVLKTHDQVFASCPLSMFKINNIMVCMSVTGWKANKHPNKIVQYFHECDHMLTIWKRIFWQRAF